MFSPQPIVNNSNLLMNVLLKLGLAILPQKQLLVPFNLALWSPPKVPHPSNVPKVANLSIERPL